VKGKRVHTRNEALFNEKAGKGKNGAENRHLTRWAHTPSTPAFLAFHFLLQQLWWLLLLLLLLRLLQRLLLLRLKQSLKLEMVVVMVAVRFW
jgi:hypothetical protein